MSTKDKSNSVHDILRIAFRKRMLFLAGAALFAIVALVVSHHLPLKYTGKAIFEFGLEAAAEEISRTSQESFGTIKERLAHDLAGYSAVAQAVEDLELTEGLPHDSEGRLTERAQAGLQAMVLAYMDAIEVVWESRSKQEDLVSVSFTHSDPKLAQDMPNTLVSNYIEHISAQIRAGLKRQHKFLETKADDAAKRVDAALREKIEFEATHAGMLPDNPAAFQERIDRATAELQAARTRNKMARLELSRLEALRGVTTTAPSEDQASKVVKQRNPEIDRLKAQLRTLEDELETAMIVQHMTESHPTVKALKVRIKHVKQRIKDEPEEIVQERVFAIGDDLIDLNMAQAAVQSALDTSRDDIVRLEALLAEYQKGSANYAPVRHTYLALLKKVTDAEGQAEHWRARLENVKIALAAAVNNSLTKLRPVEPAQKQFLPSSPSLPAILAGALVGGLAFGAGLVFLAKMLDRTISTPQEAEEYFELPIHGVIGEIVTPAQRLQRVAKHWIAAPVVGVVLVAVLSLVAASAILRVRYPHKYQEYRNFWTGQSVEVIDKADLSGTPDHSFRPRS